MTESGIEQDAPAVSSASVKGSSAPPANLDVPHPPIANPATSSSFSIRGSAARAAMASMPTAGASGRPPVNTLSSIRAHINGSSSTRSGRHLPSLLARMSDPVSAETGPIPGQSDRNDAGASAQMQSSVTEQSRSQMLLPGRVSTSTSTSLASHANPIIVASDPGTKYDPSPPADPHADPGFRARILAKLEEERFQAEAAKPLPSSGQARGNPSANGADRMGETREKEAELRLRARLAVGKRKATAESEERGGQAAGHQREEEVRRRLLLARKRSSGL
ncbi:hypothetical protein BOTBODRAFT_172273 [Botryobasidium botryosum FD-172 SS1]|uniref:Uncharacterized protein n=1 Tax=Botryobasidium botryosum (strain FD-172 SS1) TaxID=930990 RepID=A0A067MR69_BOTB1|nr:hypothetical protein BOTBODRAFT_172273 [Botryobasidium botryosum FD-172 SS1]